MTKLLVASVMLLFSCAGLKAQIEKIDTDRPDQTESAFTVPAGWLQCELGLSKEKYGSGPSILNSWTLPTLLTRYGLSKKWELRLITEYVRWGNQHRLYADTIGLLPVQVGFKVNFVEEKGIIPRISLIGHAGFNRLSSKLSNAHFGSFFSPRLCFTFQNSLSERIAIGYNLGVEWADTNESPVWFYTFAPGFTLGEKWYAYTEAFGSFEKNEKAQHTFDIGVAYYLNDNTKFDLSGGVGIAGSIPNNYIAIGLSFRCNTKKK